jgi:hypothetical protein
MDRTKQLKDLQGRLMDEFSRTALYGSLKALEDLDNPLRAHFYATGIREILGHALHELAPDQDVKSCDWYSPISKDGRPTRAQRIQYLMRGGLRDGYIRNVLKLDPEIIQQAISDAFDQLNKYTHVRPGTLIRDEKKIDAFVEGSLSALDQFFTAVSAARKIIGDSLIHLIGDAVVKSVRMKARLEEIDELQGRNFQITECHITESVVEKIDASKVHYRIHGWISLKFRDEYNDTIHIHKDDAEFGFHVTAPVETPTEFVAHTTPSYQLHFGWAR